MLCLRRGEAKCMSKKRTPCPSPPKHQVYVTSNMGTLVTLGFNLPHANTNIATLGSFLEYCTGLLDRVINHDTPWLVHCHAHV